MAQRAALPAAYDGEQPIIDLLIHCDSHNLPPFLYSFFNLLITDVVSFCLFPQFSRSFQSSFDRVSWTAHGLLDQHNYLAVQAATIQHCLSFQQIVQIVRNVLYRQ